MTLRNLEVVYLRFTCSRSLALEFGVPIISVDLGERMIEEPVSIDSLPVIFRSSGSIMWSYELTKFGLIESSLLLRCNT